MNFGNIVEYLKSSTGELLSADEITNVLESSNPTVTDIEELDQYAWKNRCTDLVYALGLYKTRTLD